MPALSIGLAEAKNGLSRVTAEANRIGSPVTILKSNALAMSRRVVFFGAIPICS